MGIEFEFKFRATPELLNQIRQAVPGQEQQFSMETTYYDTPQGALSARKYTLRRRMENETSVCTLKTPAQGQGRREFEVICDNIQTALLALCKLSGIHDLAVLTEQGIIPVCGAKFTRIAKTLEMEDCTVELALDQGILTGGGREQPLCEVEVELKQGSREAAAAYAGALAVRFGLEAEHRSKFRRAQLLARGE